MSVALGEQMTGVGLGWSFWRAAAVPWYEALMALEVPAPPLRPSERLVLSGLANLQRGVETVGGKLFLTSQRLLFNSHKLNVQRGPTEVDLKEVAAVTPCWTKFLGLIPIAPNSLAVRLRDGTELRFVLNNRQSWKTQLERVAAERRTVLGAATDDRADLTIGEAWSRLERAVRAALGPEGWGFGPPATEEEIARSERELGFTLSAELRGSLLVHDGDAFNAAGGDNVTSAGPFRHLEFLPLSSMVDEWTTWKEQISQGGLEPSADEQVRPEWWNDGWIPITVIGGSSAHHCVDLAPTELGTVGQVIQIDAKDDRRIFVAPSLGVFLLELAAEIEAGTYTVADGALVHEDWR